MIRGSTVFVKSLNFDVIRLVVIVHPEMPDVKVAVKAIDNLVHGIRLDIASLYQEAEKIAEAKVLRRQAKPIEPQPVRWPGFEFPDRSDLPGCQRSALMLAG